MLNYCKAELYKVVHRKYVYIFLVITLICEAGLMAGYAFATANGNVISFPNTVLMLTMFLIAGLYATILVGDLVYSEQYKTGTLKNELSFGIPRGRIYMGKLLVQCVTAVVLCAVIILFYLGLSWIVLPHADGETTMSALRTLGWGLLSALPLWLGAQALVNMMYFVCKSSTAAALIVAGILMSLGGVFNLMALLVNEELFSFLRQFLLTPPFNELMEQAADSAFLLKNWAVGAGWFAVTTIAGFSIFQKKDING